MFEYNSYCVVNHYTISLLLWEVLLHRSINIKAIPNVITTTIFSFTVSLRLIPRPLMLKGKVIMHL